MTDASTAYPASFGHRPPLALVANLWVAGMRAAHSLLGDGRRPSAHPIAAAIAFVLPSTTAEAGVKGSAVELTGDARDTPGDADVMQRFHRTIMPHMDAAYNFARYLSRDQDAAQDILQDAFLRACRGFGGYRGGDPRAWIFSIVRNCYHAWLIEKRRKSRLEVPMPGRADDDGKRSTDYDIASDEDTPEMAVIHATESLRVRKVIGALPEAMREVLVLRELEDLSYRQIAEIVDVPIGTVMSRLARARQEFADAWRLLEDGGKTK
ncbi:sigma-70 family RNA polymerase sigma factor [Rhizobium sp. BK251]|uniref:sigma-70 family RNA polymerase sigma factor n=1 Tax=Rhizobium sp. BK251 TaxID=2512125 RepID=UPI0010D003B2|nr:sigma-70 family RNA polymerase sigma factor [Rhizobium sp. BK251]TCL69795.1 RNA polymerase sigma-70 factor (ECF subfamily) [Rhizobium sp. BK251]